MSFERTVEVRLSFKDALARTREALAAHGFGVLTEIDMQATLRAKRGTQIAPYTILGACNPALAEGALATDPRVGVPLPCSVVVRSSGAGTSTVHVFEPGLLPALAENVDLAGYADEAGSLLEGVLAELAT
ncbi:MAG: DUF302 domain-containing protein [Actinomycetales bacterium]|nr:DUF302 domain-containing protein [Actinomycetales bacterium]